MRQFPFGRWNRELAHSVEKISDGGGEWGECSCGWQGTVQSQPGAADRDCEQHEREVFERRKAGVRVTARGIS